MSFALMQTVIDLIGLPLASKAVLLVLARHARDDGTNSKCPSVLTIAEKAGMSDKGARNALRSLEADGWIRAVGRKVGGRSLATNYTILIDRFGPPETRNDVPPKRQETRNHVPPNGHDTQHDIPPFHAETRNDVPLNPERRSAEYVHEYVNEGGGNARAHETAAVVAGISGLKVDVATVNGWLGKGYDPQLDIYPVVLEVTTKATKRIGGFPYFTPAIDRRHIARTVPQEESSNVHPIRKPKPDAGERNAAILGPLARVYQRRYLDGGSAGSGGGGAPAAGGAG